METAKSLTPMQAIELLEGDEYVHTFRQGGYAIIGADWRREKIEAALHEFKETIELSGSLASSMGHGVVIEDNTGYLFIATNKNKLDEFDPLQK